MADLEGGEFLEREGDLGNLIERLRLEVVEEEEGEEEEVSSEETKCLRGASREGKILEAVLMAERNSELRFLALEAGISF